MIESGDGGRKITGTFNILVPTYTTKKAYRYKCKTKSKGSYIYHVVDSSCPDCGEHEVYSEIIKKEETGQKEVKIRVEVDLFGLARYMGAKAYRSRGKKSEEASGLVVVKFIGEKKEGGQDGK